MEHLLSTYRPSASVRLQIRCEEFDDTSTLEGLLPSGDPEASLPDQTFEAPPQATSASGDDSTATRLERNLERRRTLEGRRSNISPEEYRSQNAELISEEQDILEDIRQADEESLGSGPESIEGSPPDDLTVIGSINPLNVMIERNGLSQADTATIELRWKDAPLDPRIIRSAHVQITLGVVRPEEFEAGMSASDSTRADGLLRSVVHAGGERGTTEFLGFVDSWQVKYSSFGDIITLECRDMSANLRDLNLGTDEIIDLTLPIDLGIEHFLTRLGPTVRGIEVEYLIDGDVPTPGDTFPQRRRPRRGARARRGRTTGDKMSAWDHITDVVRALGFIPIMRGFRLVIIEPRTLYETVGVTRMVYGRNLEELSFSRALMGVKVPTIEVRCYDSETGRTRWARYPVADGQRSNGVMGIDPQPRPSRANEVPPSGSTPTETIRIMSVTSVNDPATLERIARNAFEQLGRQEIEGNFSTADAWSYDRPEATADLLALDAGDPVELLMTAADSGDEPVVDAGEAPTTAQIQAMTRARRRDYLIDIGWTEDVAERFAALQDATGFQLVFRVQKAMIKYAATTGMKIDVDFINYITVREDAS